MRTLTFFTGVGLLTVWTALPLACGGTDEDPPPPDALAAEAGFCEAYAQTVCTVAVVDSCFGSSDETRAEDTQSCIERAQRPEVCNPAGLPYVRAGAETCLNQAAAVYADGRLNGTEVDDLRIACFAAFSRGGTEGAACQSSADCDYNAGFRCLDGGTCQIAEIVSGGLSCGEPTQVCLDCTSPEQPACTPDQEGSEFFCNEGDCVAKQEVGEDCTTRVCAAGLSCNAGTCVEKASNGTACTTAAECAGGFCEKAVGQDTGSCAATLSLTTTNGTCETFLPPADSTPPAGGTGGGDPGAGSEGGGGAD